VVSSVVGCMLDVRLRWEPGEVGVLGMPKQWLRWRPGGGCHSWVVGRLSQTMWAVSSLAWVSHGQEFNVLSQIWVITFPNHPIMTNVSSCGW
jgi:hypothetical protein